MATDPVAVLPKCGWATWAVVFLTPPRGAQQLAAFGPADTGESGLLVQELIGEANHVVARLQLVGKHTGTHPRMPQPTGRDCDVEQIWIFTLTDGLITEIRAVGDRLGMFLQLGWDWPVTD